MYLYVFYIIARDYSSGATKEFHASCIDHIYQYVTSQFQRSPNISHPYYTLTIVTTIFIFIDTQSPYISFDQGALCITTLRQLLQTTLGEGISTCPFAMTSETEFPLSRIRNLDGEFCSFFQGDVGVEGFPSYICWKILVHQLWYNTQKTPPVHIYIYM